MSDISLLWADDFTVDDTGDLVAAVSTNELQQRIIRRFLTNSQSIVEVTGNVGITQDYLFEPDYGGNARAYVGQLYNSQLAQSIQSNLLSQALRESDVDPTGTSIVVTPLPNGLTVAATISLNAGGFVAIPQLDITS